MNELTEPNQSRCIGYIGVDTGQIGLVDPYSGKWMQEDVERSVKEHGRVLEPQLSWAVVVETTHGDGVFPVFEETDGKGRRWLAIPLDHQAVHECFQNDEDHEFLENERLGLLEDNEDDDDTTWLETEEL